MSLTDYSTDGFITTVNGRQITDWGDNATPYTDEPIDPRSALRRGQGGRGIRMNRKNPGRRVTLNIQPGSPDAAYMQGLFESNANITLSRTQIGTLEFASGTEGIITNDGAVGRGGQTMTDDVFIMEFNSWTASKGGV